MPTAYRAEFRNVSCGCWARRAPAAPLVVRARFVEDRAVDWSCSMAVRCSMRCWERRNPPP